VAHQQRVAVGQLATQPLVANSRYLRRLSEDSSPTRSRSELPCVAPSRSGGRDAMCFSAPVKISSALCVASATW
jgi:hypothetical protein